MYEVVEVFVLLSDFTSECAVMDREKSRLNRETVGKMLCREVLLFH